MYTKTMPPQLYQVDQQAPRCEASQTGYHLCPELLMLNGNDTPSRQGVANTPKLGMEIATDEHIRQIKCLMAEGRYKDAVALGQRVHHDPASTLGINLGYSRLAHAEFDLHYALALIYTGAVIEGTLLLKVIIANWETGQKPEDTAKQDAPCAVEGSRRNYLLGRAHNNLGYAYYVELGQYPLALQEFKAALSYFRASSLQEEYANTCDNVGRVYVLLHRRGLAEKWMDEALELRRKLGDEYRVALSLRSQAILCSTFGQPERAYHLAFQALCICQRLGKQRGTGLVCITIGGARRQMANLSIIYSYEQRAKFLEEAEWYLHQAIAIFDDSVVEPVRLLEAQYELGCVYRDWAALVCHEGADPALAAKYEPYAVWHLQFTVGLAYESRPLWYVDACLALAQTYLRCRQFDAAQEWLERANESIPSVYTLQADGSLGGIPIEERIEGFWYRMGEIELLRGHLACDRELVNGQRQLSRGGLPCSRGLVARPMLVR